MPVLHVASVLDEDAPVADEVLCLIRWVSFFVRHQRALFTWCRDSNLLRHQRLFHSTQELQQYVTTNQRFISSRDSTLVAQLIEELPASYGSPLFIHVFTRTRTETKNKFT